MNGPGAGRELVLAVEFVFHFSCLRLRYSPTVPIDFFLKFLMLCIALGENLSFNQHILKSGVALIEVAIFCHISVDDLRACLNVATLGEVAVLEAEPHIIPLGANQLASHMPNAPDFCAVGQEVAVL